MIWLESLSRPGSPNYFFNNININNEVMILNQGRRVYIRRGGLLSKRPMDLCGDRLLVRLPALLLDFRYFLSIVSHVETFYYQEWRQSQESACRG